MFIDGRQVPEDEILEVDVCIIGAGAAGITLAKELIGQEFKVAMIESGGLEPDDQTQSLYQGEVVGLPLESPDISRLRYFGGSTNHWSGGCRPIAEGVFSRRPWIPYSGWPISRADLNPFYKRAQQIMGLGLFDYESRSWHNQLPDFYKLPFMGDRVEPAIWQYSAPMRFGIQYRDDIARAPNIKTYLNSNIIDIETDETVSYVKGLKIACLNGRRFSIRGKYFILATGGIENARILLASNNTLSAGLGNGYGLVGRFFMEHPGFEVAEILLSEPSDLFEVPLSAAGKIATRLVITEDTAAKEKIAMFTTIVAASFSYGKGYRALRRIVKSIRNEKIPDKLFRDLGIMIEDVGGLIEDIAEKRSPATLVSLTNDLEQVPNPDSRVSLSDQKDALGMARVRLEWRISQRDKRNLRRALEIVGEEIGRAELGRLKMHDWVLTDDVSSYPGQFSHHHMGTTRMSDDPKLGVVNKDCQIHGVQNLFIAGSSVFPTSGISSPTLTIVALVIRLADHIKVLMATR